MLEKMDYESNKYRSKIGSVRRLHPHAPYKMLNSISFGDGKMRKRHHSRCSDSIRVGEISLNEEMMKTQDRAVPLHERIQYFTKTDLPDIQTFTYDTRKRRRRGSLLCEVMLQMMNPSQSDVANVDMNPNRGFGLTVSGC